MMSNTFYNEILTDHNLHPGHKHDLPDANLVLEGVNPSCGDDIWLKLKVENDEIVDGAFVGDGCAISQASADMMLDLIIGKKKDEDMLVRLPDSFCHFKAIEPGHIDVKQDKVRFDKRKQVEGDKTISGIGHFITLFLQEAFQKHGILQVIVSKKNFQWFHELLFIFSISICADYCGMVISTVVPLPI